MTEREGILVPRAVLEQVTAKFVQYEEQRLWCVFCKADVLHGQIPHHLDCPIKYLEQLLGA